MEMICPECRGALVTGDGQTARCPTHGGTFRILYRRRVAEAGALSADGPAPIGSPGGDATGPASRFATMRCVQHPGVPASAQCNSCGAYVCVTCDFALPRGLHACPACAVAGQTKLSPKRKRALLWSLGLGIWCTVGLAALLGGAFARPVQSEADQNVLGLLLMLVVMVPAIIGFSIGLSTIKRRLVNPPLLWVATIWNGLVVAAFVLLCVIGMMT